MRKRFGRHRQPSGGELRLARPKIKLIRPTARLLPMHCQQRQRTVILPQIKPRLRLQQNRLRRLFRHRILLQEQRKISFRVGPVSQVEGCRRDVEGSFLRRARGPGGNDSGQREHQQPEIFLQTKHVGGI